MSDLRGLVVVALALALVTGAIHAYLGVVGFVDGDNAVGVIFVGMAIPFFIGVVFIVLGFMRRFWLKVGLGYAVLLLAAWAAVGQRDALAYADKVVEVALVAALVVSLARGRRPKSVD